MGVFQGPHSFLANLFLVKNLVLLKLCRDLSVDALGVVVIQRRNLVFMMCALASSMLSAAGASDPRVRDGVVALIRNVNSRDKNTYSFRSTSYLIDAAHGNALADKTLIEIATQHGLLNGSAGHLPLVAQNALKSCIRKKDVFCDYAYNNGDNIHRVVECFEDPR